MLLYTCPTCGRWQDVSLAQAFSEVTASLAKAFNQPTPEHLGYPCPAGHGMMALVPSDARIYVRPAVVDAEKKAEQLQAINEIAQLSQDMGMYE